MAESRSHTSKKVKTSEEIKEHTQTNLTFLDLLDVDNAANSFLDSSLNPNTNMLFQLPTEIRNMIYEYAVGTPDKPLFLSNTITPALARTSSRLRKEVIPIFLHTNTFHVLAAKRASSINPSALAFNISPETYTWLRGLGTKTPLFPSLHIHFDDNTHSGLAITCNRAGIRLTHEGVCQFCHAQPVLPILPPFLYPVVDIEVNLLHQVMAINRRRMNAARAEHAGNMDDLKARLIGAGAVDERAVALTLDDMKVLERGVSTGIATYALAVQGISQDRLGRTPLFVRTPGKVWSMIAED